MCRTGRMASCRSAPAGTVPGKIATLSAPRLWGARAAIKEPASHSAPQSQHFRDTQKFGAGCGGLEPTGGARGRRPAVPAIALHLGSARACDRGTRATPPRAEQPRNATKRVVPGGGHTQRIGCEPLHGGTCVRAWAKPSPQNVDCQSPSRSQRRFRPWYRHTGVAKLPILLNVLVHCIVLRRQFEEPC